MAETPASHPDTDKDHPCYGYRVSHSKNWGWVLVNDGGRKMLDEFGEPMWWRTKHEAEHARINMTWN